MDNIGTRTPEVKAATASVNGAEIYHEIRGSGPSVLFISGATGDAGHFERVAELLADEFTVVTYDRRGNSRSPRPPGWDTTSVDEQSDDAVGLLEALGFAPAAYFVEKVHANEPGTLLYVLTKHPTEPYTYVWIERYRDQAALQAHGETPYIGEAMSKVQDPKWWSKPHEMLQLTQMVPG